MKFSELLAYLDANTDYAVLDGTPEDSLQKAQSATHQNPYVGEIIDAVAKGCKLDGVEQALERADFVKALAPLRLKYMADDAPVEGFRIVEKLIATADAAFNDETLRTQGK